MGKSLKLLSIFAIVGLLGLGYNNCSPSFKIADPLSVQSSLESSSISCDQVDDSLRTPNSIGEVINLINALPKPVTMDCFLRSLKKPLKVMATNNTFSAQPAVGNENARIFIVNSKLSLSVVPSGAGKNLLEMSEPTSTSTSFKAEIEFPIQGRLDPYMPFSRITDTNGSSKCILCHQQEEKMLYQNIGFAFTSKIVRPSEEQRVSSYFLKNQAYICDSSVNKYRCDILNDIFMLGEAQDSSFPF